MRSATPGQERERERESCEEYNAEKFENTNAIMSASDDRRIQKTMRAHHKQTTVVIYCIGQPLRNAHLAMVGATLAKGQINAIVRRILLLTDLSARVLVLAPRDTEDDVR